MDGHVADDDEGLHWSLGQTRSLALVGIDERPEPSAVKEEDVRRPSNQRDELHHETNAKTEQSSGRKGSSYLQTIHLIVRVVRRGMAAYRGTGRQRVTSRLAPYSSRSTIQTSMNAEFWLCCRSPARFLTTRQSFSNMEQDTSA